MREFIRIRTFFLDWLRRLRLNSLTFFFLQIPINLLFEVEKFYNLFVYVLRASKRNALGCTLAIPCLYKVPENIT